MPALAALALGVVLGLAAGGKVARIGSGRLPWAWAIVPLFVVQAVARGRLAGLEGANRLALPLWAGASLLLLAIGLSAWRFRGLVVMAAGVALNLLVVLANMAMPVGAAARSLDPAYMAAQSMYSLANPGSLAPWLGDVMPFQIRSITFLMSAGDVLLMVGACVWIVSVMLDCEQCTIGDSRSA